MKHSHALHAPYCSLACSLLLCGLSNAHVKIPPDQNSHSCTAVCTALVTHILSQWCVAFNIVSRSACSACSNSGAHRSPGGRRGRSSRPEPRGGRRRGRGRRARRRLHGRGHRGVHPAGRRTVRTVRGPRSAGPLSSTPARLHVQHTHSACRRWQLVAWLPPGSRLCCAAHVRAHACMQEGALVSHAAATLLHKPFTTCKYPAPLARKYMSNGQ